MTEQDYPYSMTQQNPSELVREWMIKFQRGVDQEVNPKDILLTFNLISEEYDEVRQELCEGKWYPDPIQDVDKQALTKELCDLIWVCYFCAHKFGLPIDAAFSRVYYSNMSKLDKEGNPVLREDGKILKGPNYQPADLGDLFNDQAR